MGLVVNTYTIGSGGDYATFAAYVAAKERDMTTGDGEKDVLKVKAGDAGALDLTGGSWVTSATCFIDIVPEVDSEQFAVDDVDDPDTAISSVPSIDAAGLAAKLGAVHVFARGLLMISEGGDSDEVGVTTGVSSPAQVRDCLLVQRSTHANCTARGFATGTGFTGAFVNCLSVIEAGSGYLSAKNFDADSSSEHEAIINCAGDSAWNNAGFTGVNLKNHAKAINVLSANSAGSTGACFGTDSNGNAQVAGCAVIDTSISDNFADAKVADCFESLAYADLFGSSIGLTAEDSPLRQKGLQPESSYSWKDAFGKERIKYDIGYHQTNLVNGFDLEIMFKDMGSIIRTVNDFDKTAKALIELDSTLRVEQISSDRRRLAVLNAALARDEQGYGQIDSWIMSYISVVSSYLRDYIRERMMGSGRSDKELLGELDYWLGINSEKVSAIRIAYNYILNVTDCSDIALSGVVIPEVIIAQRIVIECTMASVSGSESWSVTGSSKGLFSGLATTGVDYKSSIDELQFQIDVTAKDGAWASDHGTYSVGDVVSYSDGYYICILEHTAAVGKEPTTTYWENYVKVGDRIYLYVTCDETAVLQMFFRDRFGYTFSNSDAEGNETILDSWAT